MDGQPILVGREPERAVLRSAIELAISGDPRLVLVHGEPGIGKTSLVHDAAQAARANGCHVLFGQCLRFGADVTSYVPFTQALSHWLRTATGEIRHRLVPQGGGLWELVPALHDPAKGVALLQIGAVLDALQADQPTLLVLDDLQWSDPSSLDVLSYLVAGFTQRQRLAILATYRDTDLGEGHRMHGWLADAVRMPSVEQLELVRMDLWAVEQMLLSRAGVPSDAGLAEEIFRRSGGNPYLADLLMREAETGGAGGVQLGGRLVDALSASWHRLSEPARKVTQLLAVAGGPVAFPVLRDLSARHAMNPQDTAKAVAEAAEQGITIETATGAIWFRHPLLAEAIAGTLKGWELAALHGDLAASWQAALDVDERDRTNFLALHYVAAGDDDRGFEWSLRAAHEAEALGGREEEASHLSIAVSLLGRVSDGVAAQANHVDLLVRAGRACKASGDDRGALRHYESALARVDRSTDPLLAGRILLELHLLRDIAGDGSTQLSVSEPHEVLALTKGLPDSQERALAFAHLAFAEVFNGRDGAAGHAETAVRLAERADTTAALIWSLAIRAQTRWGTDAGIADAERALTLAVDHGEPQLLGRAALFLSNSYESAGRYADAADITERSYRTLRDSGEFDYAAFVGAVAARWNFMLGRWDQVRPMVRELLTIARSDNSAGVSRCVAALLTAHEGRSDAALLHLRRAEELMPTAAPASDPLADTQIQVSIALGDPLSALAAIDRSMAEAVQANPIAADELLQHASRAAAALAEHATSSQGRQSALRQLERIEAARGTQPTPFRPAGPLDVAHPALGALYAAQRAQCAGDGTVVEQLWAAAGDATRRADMQYEHARALYFLAHALLTQRHDRRRATAALVTARGIAAALGATPLATDIDALAWQAHIRLPSKAARESGTPVSPPTLPASPALTAREREILDGLLSGETYAQIAARLFISDKTVSSHVSNLLRKTGTTSRIDLAALATRSRKPTGR